MQIYANFSVFEQIYGFYANLCKFYANFMQIYANMGLFMQILAF